MTAQEHEVWLWLDTGVERARSGLGRVLVRDLAGEEWRCGDLLARATNPAMRSDVLRLEILYKYGGIYADIDSVALRSFGELQTVNKASPMTAALSRPGVLPQLPGVPAP